MTINTSFHRNVFLLTQVIPPSDDFKIHFHEGMFEKPNTVGFMHVSEYLLTIYDAERFKKLIQWPVICKKTGVKYRNDVKDYLNVIASEHPDVDFPPISSSYLVCAHGTKFITIMWKLSIVVLRTYLKRNCNENILYAPSSGPTDELIKTNLHKISKDTMSNIMSHHRNMKKMQEMSKIIIEEEEKALANIKHEVFETKQSILHLISKAPVNSSIKERLANVEDTGIIKLWKQNIDESIAYIKKKHMTLKNVETLSNKITNMIFSRISGSEILDTDQLTKIHCPSILQLPLSTNVQYLLDHLYTNDKLMLYNFLQLFNLLLCQIYRCLTESKLKDLSKCSLQIEASQEDLKSGIRSFQNLRAYITSSSTDLQCDFNVNQTYQENISSMKNVIFFSSPIIKINTNCGNEGNDILKRLDLTPVEGVHKSLFSRYKREHGNNVVPISQLRTNVLVSRINFDDTISLNVSDKIPSPLVYISKPTLLSANHTGKYSRLFLSHARKAAEKGNYSMMSIPHSSKANSTAITNTVGEIHNMSQCSLSNTTKNLLDLSNEVIVSEKLSIINDKKSQCIIKEVDNIHNQQYKKVDETKDSIENTKDNKSNNVKEKTNNRRSISDLVQRYRGILKNSTQVSTYVEK
ncbi:hypothetical protein KPH14_010090 [Odynerus spinipes]|uniref:HAUS augmin-like complex subunit 6 N-terminal domain-containing protein n=1 Tax=Odynerus spinipes TaxID=1348599 RepID=A0AAD9VTD3_9HYME|nr:hypothetical protein KPH14_010090 [Odynerus spinipes]